MSSALDNEERELRMDQMRADTRLKAAQEMKAQQDWRYEPYRLVISAVLASAAIFGAAGTILGWVLRGSH